MVPGGRKKLYIYIDAAAALWSNHRVFGNKTGLEPLEGERMKLKVVVSTLVAAACMAGSAMAADVSSVNVVGYFKLDVPGARRQIMALPMTKIPDIRGVITANNSTTITVGESLVPGRYNWEATGVDAAGASYCFVEVTQSNSPFVGRHFYITNNTASILTLKDALTDINAGDLVNCGYKITSAYRIRDVFGAPGSPVLDGGNSSSDTNADLITFWSPTSGGGAGAWVSSVYYNKTANPTLGSHWVRGTTVVDNSPIDRDEGFLVTRRGAATNLTVAGEVSGNSQKVVAGAGQRIFAGGMTVVDTTFATSGLTNSPGFQGGTSSSDTNATLITMWLPESGGGAGAWTTSVYFNKTANPTLGGHFVRGTTVVDTNVIAAGTGYLIKNPGGLQWLRVSPLQ